MIKNKPLKIVTRTHYWRGHSLNELSELYLSMMLRSVSLGLVGIFVPIYLYQLGYELYMILAFYAFIMLFRIPANYLSGYLVAKVGPKHTIALSTFMNIIFMGLLLSLETYNWPLILLAFTNSVSMAMFFTAYHTDFSKVMHNNHGGKELGMMTLFQKAGSAVGPLLGGLIGSFYDIRYTIALSIVIMIASLVPLFQTSEPVKTNQKIEFKSFRFKSDHLPFIYLLMAFNAGIGLMLLLWPLYLSLTVFTSNSYANVGLVSTISTIALLATARLVGRIVDSRYVNQLAIFAGLGHVAMGVFRLYIVSPVQAAWHGAIEEQVSNALINPIQKQFYALAEEYKGQRIAYIVTAEVATVFSRALVFGAVAVGIYYSLDPVNFLRWVVFAAGLMSSAGVLYGYVVPTAKKRSKLV